jgi:omega-6 fatty acid desaturase (delta-12 desaturase)
VNDSPRIEAQSLARALSKYREPRPGRSVFELAITVGPLLIAWASMWLALSSGYFWIYAGLVVPAAGFLVRLFMIQHDCGHGAFFRTRRANDWTGRVIGVVTLTPYGHWRRTHAAHHAGSGNLDRRGMGDVKTLTVGEFQDMTRWGRLGYRLYRHPLVLFGLGPVFLFFVQNRLPLGLMRGGREPWISTMSTNAAIGLCAGTAVWLLGVKAFLLLYVPVAVLGASLGVWLFYVQHQFEATSWARNAAWDAREAALHGSSHYALPGILRWFTANIGIHHVHHLASRIPYYRLPEVMRDHPELDAVGRLTLWKSLACVRLVLWDEVKVRLISFRDLRPIEQH